MIITQEMVSVSNSLVRNYLGSNGSSALLSVYARVITYLNNQFVLYYGEVSEDIFISGTWHRPWVDYSLNGELESAVHYGFVERISRGGQIFLRLTNAGTQLYTECRDDLEKCGYLNQREQLMRSSNFTNMEEYEDIMKHSIPRIRDYRRELIDSSEIRPGMKVLELGCGAGALTLDAGLYERVGMHGSVIATDPSIGMLERAKVKLNNYSTTNVQFTRATAERLPFTDNSFDAVIGMLFLHFTDIPSALAEIKRVTRPGGHFTSISGLRINKGTDFFSEWFEPVFKRGLVSKGSSEFPDEDYLPNVASDYFHSFNCKVHNWNTDLSNVEHIVSFLVKAGTMAELSELPWSARDVLFQELIDKGYEVKNKYGSEAMKRVQPVQWFKGIVKK